MILDMMALRRTDSNERIELLKDIISGPILVVWRLETFLSKFMMPIR